MTPEVVLAALAGLVGVASLSLTSVMLLSKRSKIAAPSVKPTTKPSQAAPIGAQKSTTKKPSASSTSNKSAKGEVYSARATYYGPDKAHGRNSGDDIFQFIPSSGYTPDQLRKAGSYYCAMTLKFLKMGWMGKIVRVTGSNGKVRDVVVVDTLPDRNDGKNVAMDLFTQALFEELGGDLAAGMASIKFQLVGPSPVPVPDDSPYNPKKYGLA
jgi:hypothetical protein